MKEGRSLKNKLLVYVSLAILLANPLSTTVLAIKNYNASKSNTASMEILKNNNVGSDGIEKILEQLENDIDAAVDFNAERSNVMTIIITTMRENGADDAKVKSFLSNIGIMKPDDYIPQGTSVSLPFGCKKGIGGGSTGNDTLLGGGDPLKGLGVPGSGPGATPCGIIMINEDEFKSGITIVIEINDKEVQRILDASKNLTQDYNNYNVARGKLVATMKKYGVSDAGIKEFIDVAYLPIEVAYVTRNSLGPALESYPFLKNIFGSERMNVHLRLRYGPGDAHYGTATFSVVTRDGKVETTAYGEIKDLNPTLNVYIDQETVDKIVAGEITPIDALQQGKIGYEGVGLVKSVKFKVFSVVSGLLSRLGVIK